MAMVRVGGEEVGFLEEEDWDREVEGGSGEMQRSMGAVEVR